MLLFPEREIVIIAKKLHPFVGPRFSRDVYRAYEVQQTSPLAQLSDWP